MCGIQMEALSQGLQKIYSVARKKKGVAPLIPPPSTPSPHAPFHSFPPVATHTLHPLTMPTPPRKPLTTPTPPCKPLTTVSPVPVASVHLPRIGYATPSFNWYGTERLIRKNLASKGIPTFMYPFVCEHCGLWQCTQSSKIKHSTINSANDASPSHNTQILLSKKDTPTQPTADNCLYFKHRV